MGVLCSMPPDKSAHWKTIFFISHPKHMLWVLKRMRRFFEHPKHMFKLMGKKIITILSGSMWKLVHVFAFVNS